VLVTRCENVHDKYQIACGYETYDEDDYDVCALHLLGFLCCYTRRSTLTLTVRCETARANMASAKTRNAREAKKTWQPMRKSGDRTKTTSIATKT